VACLITSQHSFKVTIFDVRVASDGIAQSVEWLDN
jgi:hypothetical protein